MKSADVDLKLAIQPRGASAAQGPVSARLHGPFASQGAGKLPKFAFTAELQSGGQSFSAGATWNGTKGYVSLMGTPYEVSSLVMKQFVATYEQSLKSRKAGASGGLVLGSLGHRLHEVAAQRPQRGRRPRSATRTRSRSAARPTSSR